MTDLKVMETIYIHQPTGNVVMGAPADPADERYVRSAQGFPFGKS